MTATLPFALVTGWPSRPVALFMEISNLLLDRLDLFHGEATDALAHIYARLPREGLPEGCTLSGTLTGPDCRYAKTLPTRVKFTDSGAGPTLLARAILPDPCGWTPELPFLYRANIELRCRGELLASVERIYGIRRLGVRGKSFYLEGRRTVLRIIHHYRREGTPLEEWRESGSAIFLSVDNDELLTQCSLDGVMVIPTFAGKGTDAVAWLRHIAQFPAVGASFIMTDDELPETIRDAAPNMLLVELLCGHSPLPPKHWAHAAVVFPGGETQAIFAPLIDLPMIAVDVVPPIPYGSFREARAAADLLQRELAPIRDFAGYLIF